MASETIRAEMSPDQLDQVRVSEVHLRLGRLAGVVQESLHFGYDIVTQDTLLAGSRLVIEELPIIIFCPTCDREVQLPGIQSFRCPNCGTPSGDIRQGQELELHSIHFLDEAPVTP